MGSSYVNTLVACDSSFMIHSLKEFHIPGIDYTFSINTTHVAMLLVSIFIIIMAVIARVKINKVKPDDTPGMFQNAIEIIVEMLGTMVDGIMGKNANKFVNYISTLFLFIIISNISGLFGLRPPTADYGVTLCLGLITFILVQFNGIKKNKVGILQSRLWKQHQSCICIQKITAKTGTIEVSPDNWVENTKYSWVQLLTKTVAK